MNGETENKIRILWDKEMTLEEKEKLLAKYNFWDGLKHYIYLYIPEDLKEILTLKIKEKGG